MSKFRNLMDRIANEEQFQRTQLAKFSRFFGIACNVFLASYFIYGGLTISQKEIGLVVMACAGFFAGVAFFVPLIWEFYIRIREKGLHQN